MELAKETINILAYLIPGFLFQNIVRLRCPVKKEVSFDSLVVDSLMWSLIIYSISSIFGLTKAPFEARDIIGILTIAAVSGFLWSVVINRDWIAKLLNPVGPRISTHDHIFPVKGIQHFLGKWHLITLQDGSEICGIIREFDVESQETLIESGRFVLPNGQLTPEKSWIYLPSGTQICHFRTLEEH